MPVTLMTADPNPIVPPPSDPSLPEPVILPLPPDEPFPAEDPDPDPSIPPPLQPELV